MKKLLMLMLVMVMLAGCTAVKVPLDVDFKKEVLKSIREASEVELPEFSENNSHKEYYDYYLFQGVGRKEIDEISNIFIFYDNEAVLNLDVAGILKRSVYEDSSLRDIESFQGKSLYAEGSCRNSRGLPMSYRMEMKVVDGAAYIILQTNQFIFTASCPLLEADETIYEMMKTLRTCSVDTKLVIDTYSNQDKATYRISNIRLFREILPESGRIIDYMDDWKNDPSYTIIDRESRPGEIPSASDIGDVDNEDFGGPEDEPIEENPVIDDEDDTIPVIEEQTEESTENTENTEENTDASDEASGG